MWSGKDATAGYVGGAVTDAALYVVDSYKTQIQSKSPLRIVQLTRGLLPLSLTGSGPSFALFFGLYAPLHEHLGGGPAAVAAASMAATFPATMIGVPADTVKKQVVLGNHPSARVAAAALLRAKGVQGLFTGWQANLLRDIPFAVFKMTLYEGMLSVYRRTLPTGARQLDGALSALDHGMVGFASGCLSAVLTNPLDVINTRMKAAANVAGKSPGILQSAQQIARAEGLPTLVFSGLPPRVLIFGLGSSIFWSVHGTVRTGLLYA
mmetsp:Transcript_27379/g.52135  ORF Transcript_27379/g.52135 Transcript_27379/m.52135 type:complete len:265 (+) Transcript_27379:111-905(+)